MNHQITLISIENHGRFKYLYNTPVFVRGLLKKGPGRAIIIRRIEYFPERITEEYIEISFSNNEFTQVLIEQVLTEKDLTDLEKKLYLHDKDI